MAAAAVLRNTVIVGSVNANKRQWYRAGQTLAKADRKWLAKLITRREKPEDFMKALDRQPDDIKVVIQFSEI
jgi:threonine dehydrogenase-like Zn-dependent dehydrogenase